jgi:thiol-disulfide isomerase/thioredoxin
MNAQSGVSPSSPLIKVPLTSVLKTKPFGGAAKITAILSTNAGFQGLPDTLTRYVIRTMATLVEQDLYERYQRGEIAKKNWLQLQSQLDTIRISKKPIRQEINILVGLTKTGKKVVVVDQNNNQDFSDDSLLTYLPLLGVARQKGQYLTSIYSIVDTLPIIKVQTEIFEKGQIKALTWLVRPSPYNRVQVYSDTAMADLHIELHDCTHQEGKLTVAGSSYRFAVSNVSVSPVYRPADIEVKLASGSEDFPIDSEKAPSYQIGQTLDLGHQTYKLLGVSYLGDTLYLSHQKPANHSIGTRINQFAPSFNLIDLSGQSIRSAGLRGSYVILDFWGSWCGPCIEMIPEIKAFAQQYRAHKNIRVISIAQENSDRLDALKRLIANHAMTWPQVAERPSAKMSNKTTVRYQVNTFPTTLLLSPTGQILHRGSGKASFEELKSVLSRELAKTKI